MISLGADFGGTRIKLGVVRDGVVVAQSVIPAESSRHLTERLEAIAAGFEKICAQAGVALSDCDGVGFSYPSIIDRRTARILDHFGKFGDASAVDLRSWAEQRLHLPLEIDNDARMALIGEWRYGAGRGCDNCVIITLGTGIGVSAVIEGQVLRGVHGQAGILGGHTTLQTNGRSCVCGNVGCAELLASTSVIARLAREHPLFACSPLAMLQVIDYAAIFRFASEGDACAIALRDRSLETWAALAVNLIHVFDPELIIFGGGIMGRASEILPFVRDYVSRHAHTPWGRVKVVASELGDRAALLACEWLVHEHDVEKAG
ncbi:MAG TPA: ROK family protein [Verrucomicrobiae bacterium]